MSEVIDRQIAECESKLTLLLREVKDTLQDEVSAAAPGVKATLADAATNVKEQIKESAGRVAKQAKQEVRKTSPGTAE